MSTKPKGHYGMNVLNLNRGIDLVSQDLDYLCSIVEHPDPEFAVTDALVVAGALFICAIVALANQLSFMSDDISRNPLSTDGKLVKMSEEEVMILSDLSDEAEEAVQLLEEICKISLKNN